MKKVLTWLGFMSFVLAITSLAFADSGDFVASKKSNRYHKQDCYLAKKIDKDNVITFKNAQEAQAKGYLACQVCLKGPVDETYVGSKNSNVYHMPMCKLAKNINDENKLTFASRSEAMKAGYKPCQICVTLDEKERAALKEQLKADDKK